jgi:hypothetical protein
MKKFLIIIISSVLFLQSFAQQSYIIANGTTTSEYLPVYGYMMDASQHNQFIYPASHLATLQGALILKISFHANTTVTTNWGGATCVISLANPLDSNFVNAVDDTTSLTEVYSGPIALVNGIMEIPLSSPFLYQGGNLMIDIVTTTTGDYETVDFLGISAVNGGIYNLEYDINASLVAFLPKATIEYVIGTPIVVTTPATNILSTSATLRGAFYNITTTNYGFQYMLNSETDWASATSAQASSNPMSLDINSLLPDTDYKYRAFALDGVTSIYGTVRNFSTIPTPDTLPYFCTFEDTTQNGNWILTNGSALNQWFIGVPGSNDTTGNGLYISDDNGLTASYDNNSSATVFASTYIQFNGNPEFTLSFDWKAMGGYWEGYVAVYLVPVSYTINAGTMIPNEYEIGGQYIGSSIWLTETILLGSQYSNNTYQLVFMWYNEDYGMGSNPPGLIDDVVITPLTCASPTNLVVSNITTTNALLTWHHYTPAPEFIIEYQVFGDTIWNSLVANDTTFLLNTLLPSTSYSARVKAVCTPGDTSYFSDLVSFTTLCIAESAPTLIEPFLTIPPSTCWNMKSGTLPITGNAILTDAEWGWDIRNTFSTSTAAVNLYSDQCQHWLISPSIDLGLGTTLYQMDVDIARTAYYESTIGDLNLSPNARFVILISTDNGQTWNSNGILMDWNNSTGIPFSSLNNTLQTQTIALYDSVAMAPYSGIVRFAFFAYENDANYIYDNDIHVDNFQIVPYNSCVRPISLSTSNYTLNTIELNWTSNGTATEWEIEYGSTGFTHGTGTFVTTTNHPYNVTNLISATTYDFYVRSICGIGDSSYWSVMTTASTTCLPMSLPYSEPFNSAVLPSCWSQTISGSIESNIWSVVDYGAAGGTGYEMMTEMYYGTGISRLISPAIDFTGVPYALLTFKQLYFDEDGVTLLKIQTSQDLITWTDQEYEYTQMGGIVGPETAQLTIEVPSGINYVAWVIEGDHELIGWAIDDVTIEASTNPCIKPTNLQVNSISESSAIASWTVGGSESSWIVEYKLVSSTNWTSATTTTPTYTMTGLQSNTDYLVRVKAVCTEDESSFTTAVPFTTTVGIGENVLNHAVELCPNPTSTFVTLRIKSDQIQMVEAQIFDIYGKLLKTVSLENNTNTMDVSDLSSGVYLLKLNTNQGTINKKFVKK